MRLGRGTLVVVELDPTVGHEQRGVRPCVVVSNPDISSDQRFPLVCVVPITGTPGEGLLYPPLAPGSSGLAKHRTLSSISFGPSTSGGSAACSANSQLAKSPRLMRG